MSGTELLTIREMSEACQVSRQTVYNIVKEIEENENISEFITVKDNVKHLTAKGQAFIRDRLNISTEEQEEPRNENKASRDETKTDTEYRDKYIEMLEEQIKIKDEQIRGLNLAIEEIQQRQKEANILQAMEKRQLTEGNKDIEQEQEEDTPKSFFSRLKNIFK